MCSVHYGLAESGWDLRKACLKQPFSWHFMAEVIEFEGYKFSRLGRFVSLLVPMNTLARTPGELNWIEFANVPNS